MPCDTQREVTVDGKKFNIDLLAKAMKELGYKVTVEERRVNFNGGYYEQSVDGGRFTFYDRRYQLPQDKLNTIAAEYAMQVVDQEMKKNGWLEQLGNVAAKVKAVVRW
jgi:hypothetical protein